MTKKELKDKEEREFLEHQAETMKDKIELLEKALERESERAKDFANIAEDRLLQIKVLENAIYVWRCSNCGHWKGNTEKGPRGLCIHLGTTTKWSYVCDDWKVKNV